MTTTQNTTEITFNDDADKEAEMTRLATLKAEFTARGWDTTAITARRLEVIATIPERHIVHAQYIDLMY